MLGWSAVVIGVAYLGGLCALAGWVDRRRPAWLVERLRPTIYALSLGVFCTAWAFVGAAGFAAQSGWAYLALSLGPALVLLFFSDLIRRVARLVRAEAIASVADFMGARYGKSEAVAAVAAIAAILGVTPYIALQLKAISSALALMLGADIFSDIDAGAGAAVLLAALAMAFGSRHAPTEPRDGVTAAIALESLVKLAAILCVGGFALFVVHDGPADLIAKARAAGATAPFESAPTPSQWLALTALSFGAFLLLPRLFHVAIVGNRSDADIARARWLFPLYLVAFNLAVAPIAIAGLATFGAGARPDDFALVLPLHAGASAVAIAAFLGLMSAAGAMVIVEAVALGVMISNDLAMPVMLRGRRGLRASMSKQLVTQRRIAIAGVMTLAYLTYRLAGDAPLTAMGLIAIGAVAQLAPAFFLGLSWRKANGRGALAGIVVGLIVWTWTMVLPAFAQQAPAFAGLVAHGPLGLEWLKPQALFGSDLPDPTTHALFFSLGLNLLAFVLGSVSREPYPVERQQAALFCSEATEIDGAQAAPINVRPWRSRATTAETQATVARYLGPERAEIAFRGFENARGAPLQPEAEADLQTVRFAERLLASAIGAGSARLVLSMLLTRRAVTSTAALKLLDDASAAMQTNRDVLQNALDHSRQGVTAIDKNMRLVCWNRQFRELFDLPEEMIHFGVGLDEIFRFNAARGLYGPVQAEEFIADRIQRFVVRLETLRTRLHPSGRVIEVRSARMPDGGVVTTYTDISDTVAAQEALERANENLERRVRERTRELTRLNQELARAKTEADEANISKTRFLAAASHDILQPLNAARLFATSLAERAADNVDQSRLAKNVDASLDAVEEILSTLLDISRLDTGAMKPELSNFRLDDIVSQLGREFAPVAAEKGLRLVVVPSSVTIRSDRRLIRRVVQNLVSNAIKYTPSGRVLVGVRRVKGKARIEVWDTGLGIESGQQRLVFREFKRLEQGAKVATGVGLGLSIVDRIARVLDSPVTLRSQPGRGSVFSVETPLGAAVPVAAPTETVAPQRASALAGLVVLAIDNEPAILEGMKTLLEGWGCETVTAPSQREAERALTRARVTPDVIIADYHLDESDGVETITGLRWKLGRNFPAVLATADRSPGVREKAEAKDIRLLMKPLKPAALRALLAQLTAGRRQAAE